jgi:hypothetical protein
MKQTVKCHQPIHLYEKPLNTDPTKPNHNQSPTKVGGIDRFDFS